MRIGPARVPILSPQARPGRVVVQPVPPVPPVAAAPEGPPPEVSDAPWPETLMELSAVAQHLAERRAGQTEATKEADPSAAEETEEADERGPDEESPAFKAAVAKLQARDTEVRAHEAAHAAVAGPLGGAPNFVYQQGPDGKMYAIGGSVAINTSEGATPEETLQRAEQVRAAALAPAKPSGADRAIASLASNMAAKARMEKAQEAREEQVARYEQMAAPASEQSTLQAVL